LRAFTHSAMFEMRPRYGVAEQPLLTWKTFMRMFTKTLTFFASIAGVAAVLTPAVALAAAPASATCPCLTILFN
jgi:hypothetical protein